jgi:uncharacterized protein (DUF305 family)
VALVMHRVKTCKFTKTRIVRLGARVCMTQKQRDASMQPWLRASEGDESGSSKVKVDGSARL